MNTDLKKVICFTTPTLGHLSPPHELRTVQGARASMESNRSGRWRKDCGSSEGCGCIGIIFKSCLTAKSCFVSVVFLYLLLNKTTFRESHGIPPPNPERPKQLTGRLGTGESIKVMSEFMKHWRLGICLDAGYTSLGLAWLGRRRAGFFWVGGLQFAHGTWASLFLHNPKDITRETATWHNKDC